MRFRWMHPRHISRQPWPVRLALGMAGLLLIVVGIIGWLTPVVPGFPLIFVGLPMLFGVHPRGAAAYRRLYDGMRRRWRAWRTRRRTPRPSSGGASPH